MTKRLLRLTSVVGLLLLAAAFAAVDTAAQAATPSARANQASVRGKHAQKRAGRQPAKSAKPTKQAARAAKPAPIEADSGLRGALASAEKGDWITARRMAAPSPPLFKMVRWMEIKQTGSGAFFEEIARFIDENPDWPSLDTLRRRAEETMAPATPDASVRAWFERGPPRTVEGASRYIDLLASAGDEQGATAQARRAWTNITLTPRQEQDFYGRYGARLRPEDHVARLDRLLWDGQEAGARSAMAYVDADQQALAEARLKLRREDKGAEHAIDRVPQALRSHPGLLYERVRALRQKGMDDEARAILLSLPRDSGRPDLWWSERSTQTRRALALGLYSDAYKIASENGLSEGSAFAEAEWLSGWIALRHLNNPGQARQHFDAMAAKVASKVSKARGGYWTGRAYEAMGNAEQARHSYSQAARHGMTFYGQLAAARLGNTRPRLVEPAPTAEDEAAFRGKEVVQLVRVLNSLGRADLADPFLERLVETSPTVGQEALVVALAHEIKRPDIAVRLTRRARRDDANFVTLGYPVVTLPHGDAPERALTYAMIRQESAFNTNAVSRAGARGLLQLMPQTAKVVAKTLKVKYTADRLNNDPAFNLELGRSYMDRQISDFRGSYVLAIAAYNAGPGRVRYWMRTLGDPRRHDIDVIDWIESIPISETRDYVQRVLEGVQVYRLRLGEKTETALIEQDLMRGRGQAEAPVDVICAPDSDDDDSQNKSC
ncbi:MAG: lytic transglycosylase domain-containing protein [Alphaproteobacteria bacterium]